MENKRKILILLDGNAIIHRAYHALPPLVTKKGELVNAVYGFASTLLSVLDKFKPDYIAASFDLAAPTFRHKQFKEYKATRMKAPDELYNQIDRVKEITRAFNVPIYEKEGFEADDVIGTIARQAKGKENEKIEIIIVTGDLDALQLVNENIKVYTMRRGLSDSVLYDEQKVNEKYGLKPEQLKDFKGLRGDVSDNIPGVKGIGEKTAADLLQKYKTLENIYQNIGEIKGANREKLERNKAQAFLSRELGTIKTNVPLTFNLEKSATRHFDRQKAIQLFQELNFFSLIKRLPDDNFNSRNANNIENGVRDFKYEKIENQKLDDLILEIEKQKEIALSMEKGVMAVSWKNGRVWFWEMSEENIRKIKPVLENKIVSKISFDFKELYKKLKRNYQIFLEGINFDIELASYVLNPGEKIEFFKIVLEELGEEFIEEKKGQLSLIGENKKEIQQKVCRQADYYWKLKNKLEEKINFISVTQAKEKSLKDVFEKIEMPLIKILAEMEETGVRVNKLVLKEVSQKLEKQLSNLEKKIYILAGEKFNINSSKQLTGILFEKLKISTEGIKKIKTGFSTAVSELEKIKKKHSIVAKIEEYRELFKIKTTYLDALPQFITTDGRIHTTFKQTVTATGRLSSENPNLQNIPIRTDLGRMIRTAFEAEEGCVFLSADYSQIELRIAAHLSEDKKFIQTFWNNEDIHRKTAAEINKVSLSQVTEKMRREAKALNFGMIYGMSSFGFSESAGISREEAREFMDAYFKNFSQMARYIVASKEFAKKNGYAETETGRRRYLAEINSHNFQTQAAAERMAVNMPIQGLAADIMKLAMIKIAEFIKSSTLNGRKMNLEQDARMILQVHDEIILEVKEEIAAEMAEKVKKIMENIYPLRVPLAVNIKIGKNWGEI